MKKPSATKHHQQGFTLVELLVVISLVGILAGVTISIINPVKQRKVAEDGVKQSNLQKFALGIEAYGNANSKYPIGPLDTTGGPGNTPDNVPDEVELTNFVVKIPNGEPTSTAIYNYYISADSFAITVTKSDTTTSECFKYRSAWGKIKMCPNTSCLDESTVAGCI
jgi:prepilin-type N-terminal cleavage/methylation domain-containing protein